MKIKVLRDYSGKEGTDVDKNVFAGSEHHVSRARGAELFASGLVEILSDDDSDVDGPAVADDDAEQIDPTITDPPAPGPDPAPAPAPKPEPKPKAAAKPKAAPATKAEA